MHRMGGEIQDLINRGLVAGVTAKYISEHRRRRAVARIENTFDAFVDSLTEELRSGEYRPGIYHPRHIGGNGIKERDILIPPVRDAIAAACLVEAFCGFAGRRLYPHTYCNRRGYGCALLVRKLHAHLMHERPTYFLKFDIRKCFDSIRHADVVDYIQRTVKGRTFQRALIRLALPACIGPVGIPIGNGLSHHMANGILSPIWFAARRLPGVNGLWAYMDDVVIVGNNKRKLTRAAWHIGQMLAAHGLRFKYPPAASRCTEGIDIAGFRLWPDGRRRLRRRNYRHARRAVRSVRWQRAAAYLGMAQLAHDVPLVRALRAKVKKGATHDRGERRKTQPRRTVAGT